MDSETDVGVVEKDPTLRYARVCYCYSCCYIDFEFEFWLIFIDSEFRLIFIDSEFRLIFIDSEFRLNFVCFLLIFEFCLIYS
jgi:hypothetical protein